MSSGWADHTATILLGGARLLDELRSDPSVQVHDHVARQHDALRRLLPAPPADVLAEPTRWVFYPWRRAVVHVLGPRGFRLLRLDRNRNLITSAELDRLSELCLGVVGLSVGHVIAYSLAAQGLCGELRLADFDELELSNLNRVPATVLDLGVNKAVVCARRIAELDPYLPVTVLPSGITAHTVDHFVDGLSVLIEECDSLEAKILVRDAARIRRIPVLMTTSDRGLLDVERFDVEPTRPLLHGVVGDLDTAELRDLTDTEKVAYSLRLVDPAEVSDRMSASLIEVGTTLSTWPQLSSEVALNTAILAEAVRRIGLGEDLPSGRARIDVARLFDRIESPVVPSTAVGDEPVAPPPPAGPYDAVVAAAARAPSGGNAQPWHIEVTDGAVSIAIATGYLTTMDVGFRASAVAVGAAAFNARVAAAAHDMVGEVGFRTADERSPLVATVRLTPGSDPTLASLYEPMLRRETNRRRSERVPIGSDVLDSLREGAAIEGAHLEILDERDQLESAAAIFAAADRIRYLTPHLHAEMFAELRWPGDPSPDWGIDVRSLELSEADLVMLELLRRPDVMAYLKAWNGGSALGDDTYRRVVDSAAVGVVSVRGRSLADYARGGSAAEAVWVRAQSHGLAVQPISPAFLYAADPDELAAVSPAFADELGTLQYNFGKLAGTGPPDAQALVLRFGYAPRPSVTSRRRAPVGHHSADGVTED